MKPDLARKDLLAEGSAAVVAGNGQSCRSLLRNASLRSLRTGYPARTLRSFDSPSGEALTFAQDRTLSLSKGSALPSITLVIDGIAQGSGTLRARKL
jgi:hypothetical protein